MSSESNTYDLFLSYATEPDYALVRMLEGFLESFHELPTPENIELRPLQVCVDGSDFTLARGPEATEDIQSVVESYLARSAELLVLCSAASRASRWVEHELRWFLEHRGPGAIRLAVTEGRDPGGDPEAFFSPTIVEHGLHERIWYDLRGYRGQAAAGWSKVRELDDERTRLAADLSGQPAGTIQPIWFREQLRVERRRARLATAQRLALEARLCIDTHPQRAVLLATEAYEATATDGFRIPAAEQSMRDALAGCGGLPLGSGSGSHRAWAFVGRRLVGTRSGGAVVVWDLDDASPSQTAKVFTGHESGVVDCTVVPGTELVVTGSRDRTVRIWDLAAPDPEAAQVVLHGHPRPLTAVAASPDGRWLASGGGYERKQDNDLHVRLWDLHAPDVAASVTLLRGHTSYMKKLAFSPTGQWLASASADHSVRLWNMSGDRSEALVLAGHANQPWCLVFSPSGRWLASGDAEGSVRVWDLERDDPSRGCLELSGHTELIRALAFSPDDRLLVSGSWDKSARVWDLGAADPTHEVAVLRTDRAEVDAVAICPSGRRVVTGDRAGRVMVWALDAADPAAEPHVLLGHEQRVDGLVFDDTGRTLASSGLREDPRVWQLDERDPMAPGHERADHDAKIASVGIAPDGQWCATASYDRRVALWRLEPGAESRILAGHRDKVRVLAFEPGGRLLATGADDGVVRVHDLEEGRSMDLRVQGHHRTMYALRFDPTGRRLVASTAGGDALVWNVDGLPERELAHRLSGHTRTLKSMAFDPSGRWLLTGAMDGGVRLWDLHARCPERAIIEADESKHSVWSVAISARAQYLAAGCQRGELRLWRRGTDEKRDSWERQLLAGHRGDVLAVAFSPDGARLVSVGRDATVRLWDPTAVEPEREPMVLRGHEGSIFALAISPDARFVATAGTDATVRLWDLHQARPGWGAVCLRGHRATVWAMAFSPDGHWLVTGDHDGVARLWSLRPEELPARARRVAGRNFTPDEWQRFFLDEPWRPTFELEKSG